MTSDINPKEDSMKLPLAFLFSMITLACAFSQDKPLWLRYPSISPDGAKIAFTYKGDLYIVPSGGGTATPLTFHEAHDFIPVWSHDGKSIAFASDRYGNYDVFIVSADGSEPKRLTYHSAAEYPYTFTPDDKAVLFGAARQDLASHRQYPTDAQPELYQVPSNGGRVSQVLTTPAEAVQISKDGQRMLYQDKKGFENDWRKHHTSSIARDIWMYDPRTSVHTMMTSFKGEDRNPVFANGDKSMFYLSEESGSCNVHRLEIANPGQNQQITSFKKFPVRFLSIADDGLLCFSYDGELYTARQGEEPRRVPVNIRTEAKTNNQKVLPISGNVSECAVSPDGKELAYIVRGEVFVSSVEGNVTKRITNTPEEERFLSFSPDGKALL